MHNENEFLQAENIDGYFVSAEMKCVWLCEIDILKQFVRVCEKYGLRYYVAGGTLLGMIRHKGFIPWDDDIDIDMPREDYEQLKRIAPEEFSEPYFFQSIDTDINYARPHLQIRNSNTTAIVKHEVGLKFNQGIFIDIFPLDSVPNNKLKRKCHSMLIRFMQICLKAGVMINPKKNPNKLKCLAHYLVSPIFYLIGYKRFYRYFENACTYYNKKNTDFWGEISFDYSDKCIWRKEWFKGSLQKDFEFMSLSCPVGYDEVLRTTFGDYMVPVKAPSYHGSIYFSTNETYKKFIDC